MARVYLTLIGLVILFAGSVVLLGVVAAELHERSHWVTARFWTDEVRIEKWRGVVATSVVYQKPFDIPKYGIRLTGAAPVIYGWILGTSIYLLVGIPDPGRLILVLPFFAGGLLSPSDILCVVSPDRSRTYAAQNDAAEFGEMIAILKEEL